MGQIAFLRVNPDVMRMPDHTDQMVHQTFTWILVQKLSHGQRNIPLWFWYMYSTFHYCSFCTKLTITSILFWGAIWSTEGARVQYTRNLERTSSCLRLAFSQKCFFESHVAGAEVGTNKSALKGLLALHTQAAQELPIWSHKVGRLIEVEYIAYTSCNTVRIAGFQCHAIQN